MKRKEKALQEKHHKCPNSKNTILESTEFTEESEKYQTISLEQE